MTFDVSSLAFILGMVSCLLWGIMWAEHRVVRAYPGPGWWVLANMALALGFGFNALRSVPLAYALSVIANNGFFLASMALFHVGLLLYLEKPLHLGWHALYVAVGTAVATVFVLAIPHEAVRRINLSLGIALMSFVIAWTLWRAGRGRHRFAQNLLIAVFLLHGLFMVARGFSACTLPLRADLSQSPWTILTYFVQLAASILETFGFILLLNQRLNADTTEDRENLELIFNTSPDAVLITRLSDGLFVRVNEGFTAIAGYEREDIVGKTTRDINLWANAPDREKVVAALKACGRSEEMEAIFVRKDGTHLIGQMSARLIQLKGQAHMISFTRDITQRKASEERIQQLVCQLELEKGDAQKIAMTDGLTGLANRRHFDEVLAKEFYRLNRGGTPLSMIMMDVDSFKLYNDRYGHLAGDDCLKKLADAMRTVVRRMPDLVARYGGEEFSVILPETDPAGARQVAEHLRKAVEALAIPHVASQVSSVVTISLGVVTAFPEDVKVMEQVVALADQALYIAKQRGRNQLYVARTSATLPEGRKQNSLVRLVWSDSNECGNDIIDSQHRNLYELSNQLLSAVLRAEPKEQCMERITTLLQEIVAHFEAEEHVLGEAGYAELGQHRQIHAELVSRAKALAERYGQNESFLGELFSFLAHDVVAVHMLTEDKKFFDCVREARPE